MDTRPHSPETAAFVASSLEAWNRFFSAGDDQSDVDSTRQNLSMPEDLDSLMVDSVEDALLSVLPMPLKSDQTYEKLVSVMGSSYLELAELDIVRLEAIVKDVYKLLRDAILTGYSRRWAEFDSWLDFGHKLSKVLLAKKAVAMPDEEDYDGDVDSELSDCEKDPHFTLVENGEDPADDAFIRELYSRGIKELLDFDDVAPALQKKPCQSREHAPQKVAARHAPAVFPPANPHPARGATRDPPLLKAIHHSRGRPNGSAQRADGGGAHHGEPPQAWPAHLRPYQHTLHDSVSQNGDGSAADIGGGGARRARSSTSSPVTRTAKMSGGAAARNMAVWDEAIFWRGRCGRRTGGGVGFG
ncbi:hypothetical protein EDB86DRAFT_2834286 [Lactarius hatsudake]|nr:hypothetical protein EDB86DRAFT_2834286 [Lactarius hatsudake]